MLAVGCSRDGDSKPVAQDGQMDGMWTAFRQIYLSGDGRIVDNGNGGISHSEGQGYGMVLATLVGDRPRSRPCGWTERTLLRGDVALFAWRYDPRAPNPVADTNNASDGDMLIAWA
jgi:endoglucanase